MTYEKIHPTTTFCFKLRDGRIRILSYINKEKFSVDIFSGE